MKLFRPDALLVIALVCSGLVLLAGCEEPPAYMEAPPVKVTTVKPEIMTVPVYLEENGETEAVQQAIVRARVPGILEELTFTHESDVAAGDKLFQIEQDEYKAAVQAAEAAVTSAKAEVFAAQAQVEVAEARISATQAEIDVAQADFGRVDLLLGKDAVAQSEWDAAKAKLDTAKAAMDGSIAGLSQAKAAVKNAEAARDKAEANLVQARLDLEWTTVKAPIAGQVTRTLVKKGNLVKNGDELIEIVDRRTIWANFNISERFLLELDRHTDEERRIKKKTIAVELKRSGDPDYLFQGFLDYADPKVDQETGTMQLRAEFENSNPSGQLIPGLFVRVRLQIGEIENAMLVPERAIGRDQTGAFVYTVGSDNKAERKNVELGIKHGDRLVINSGIESSDSVVVEGLQRLRPGAEVNPN